MLTDHFCARDNDLLSGDVTHWPQHISSDLFMIDMLSMCVEIIWALCSLRLERGVQAKIEERCTRGPEENGQGELVLWSERRGLLAH